MSKKKSRATKRGTGDDANNTTYEAEAGPQDLSLSTGGLQPAALFEQKIRSTSNGTGEEPHATSSSVVNDLGQSEEEEEHLPIWIEVKDTESKGQAVFAVRKIKPGTLILSESPLIRLSQKEEDEDKNSGSGPSDSGETEAKNAPILESYFNHLPRTTQKSYLKLFDSRKSGFSRVKSVYYSNCYNLSKPHSKIQRQNQQLQQSENSSQQSPGGSAIGQTASRINHSCIPNVQFSFDETTQRMLFHAIKPIPKGREIVSSYNSVYEVRATRQRKQQLYYGFQCDCEACHPQTDFWMKSDDRRKAMIEAKKEIRSCEKAWDEYQPSKRQQQKQEEGDDAEQEQSSQPKPLPSPSPSPSQAMSTSYQGPTPFFALENLETALMKEGLTGLPLADVYKDISKWAEREKDMKKAKAARRKELEICKICLGEKSGRVEGLIMKIEMLTLG